MMNQAWSGVAASQTADLFLRYAIASLERGFLLVPCTQPAVAFPLLMCVGLRPLLGWIWSLADPSVGQIN